jgi:hypothetical protein
MAAFHYGAGLERAWCKLRRPHDYLSIQRSADCTTLAWASQPGETYTVFWTDQMNDQPYWRVAAVNVRSGGTTTSWSEGDCGEQQGMMAGGDAKAATLQLSAEEFAAKVEEAKVRAQAGVEFLKKKLEEAIARTRRAASSR